MNSVFNELNIFWHAKFHHSAAALLPAYWVWPCRVYIFHPLVNFCFSVFQADTFSRNFVTPQLLIIQLTRKVCFKLLVSSGLKIFVLITCWLMELGSMHRKKITRILAVARELRRWQGVQWTRLACCYTVFPTSLRGNQKNYHTFVLCNKLLT